MTEKAEKTYPTDIDPTACDVDLNEDLRDAYMKRMEKEIYLSTERHENLVDACCEMIFKLKERYLL